MGSIKILALIHTFITKTTFLILLSLLFSCSSPLPNFELYRRPQVIAGESAVVLDYNPILEDYDRKTELALQSEEGLPKRTLLDPTMFEPYKPTEDTFHLSTGDLLEIAIYEDKETFADTVSVAPDGKIYWTFLEGIQAEGRNVTDLRAEMQEKMKQYYVEPAITLTVKSTITESFKILGRVNNCGVYSTLEPIHLREAIGVAGGLLNEDYTDTSQNSPQESLADLANSFLIRDGKKLDIDFHDLFYNPSTRFDIFVRPGDYIYIASTSYAEVYVLGGVQAPSQIRYLKGMCLTEALATTGGWTIGNPYSADISKVLIIRGCLDRCPVYVQVDLRDLINGKMRDVVLHPGDIIYVYNKTLRFGRQLVRLALSTFIQAFGTSAGSFFGDFSWFHISTDPKTTDPKTK